MRVQAWAFKNKEQLQPSAATVGFKGWMIKANETKCT
jgi:hypothetical protein